MRAMDSEQSSASPSGSDAAGWAHNIGGFERHYAGWRIESPDGSCYTAQRRRPGARPSGPKLRARALDELAAKIEAAS